MCTSLFSLTLPHVHVQSKANDHCHLRVHVQPDNYVVFESVKTPGEYVAMQKNDVPPEKVKDLGPSDEIVQFFVRVEVRVRKKHWQRCCCNDDARIYSDRCTYMCLRGECVA